MSHLLGKKQRLRGQIEHHDVQKKAMSQVNSSAMEFPTRDPTDFIRKFQLAEAKKAQQEKGVWTVR